MKENQQLGALEAMLFAHAEPVETARLADALRLEKAQTEVLCSACSSAMTSRKAVLPFCTLPPTAGR